MKKCINILLYAAFFGILAAQRPIQEYSTIHFNIYPETNCQGLFNQIHKNLQKRCQKHRMAPDTSFDRLHFSVQQVFAEIRIVWQLVDI